MIGDLISRVVIVDDNMDLKKGDLVESSLIIRGMYVLTLMYMSHPWASQTVSQIDFSLQNQMLRACHCYHAEWTNADSRHLKGKGGSCTLSWRRSECILYLGSVGAGKETVSCMSFPTDSLGNLTIPTRWVFKEICPALQNKWWSSHTLLWTLAAFKWILF